MIELLPYNSDNATLRKGDTLGPSKPRTTTWGERVKLFNRQGKGCASYLMWGLIVAWFIGSFFIIIPTVIIPLEDSIGESVGCVMFFVVTLFSFGGAAIVGLIYINLWHYLVRMRLGTPHMQASAKVVRRGEDLQVIFRQGIPKPIKFNGIKIQLARSEWVRYTCGTNTCTDEEHIVIQSVDYPAEYFEGGLMLEKRAEFTMPVDAMHNLDFTNNKLTWLIKVQLDIHNWIDFTEAYEIQVPVQGATT